MPSVSQSRIVIVMQRFAPLLIGAIALAAVVAGCVYMAMDARTQAGLRAQEAAESLVHLLERDVARNIEVLDLSLQAVADGVARPDIMANDRRMRKMILFDRSASASGLGALIVFDKDGNNILDSLHDDPFNIQPVTDRDYFKTQVDADHGLFISQVYKSRLIGKTVIGLSRRISDGDGAFLGVALATIEVDYLSELISKIQLGPGAVVTLLRSNGSALLRQGPNGLQTNVDMGKMTIFQRINGRDAGSFVSTSQYDHVERLYGFHQVGKYPLVLAVGIATETIYSDWKQKTTLFAVLILVMTSVVFALLAKLLGELKLKATTAQRLTALNHELERLSLTDSLTGLGNRRYFDDVFEHETRRSDRTGNELSLALIDIDHFKLFNDTYGHAEGDRALKLVANALKSALKRPGDMVFRVGGEEFAVVLPQTDETGAAAVCDAMCRAVRGLKREHTHSEIGYVTISVGLNARCGIDPVAAYEAADKALYAAKRSGRNRVTPALRSISA